MDFSTTEIFISEQIYRYYIYNIKFMGNWHILRSIYLAIKHYEKALIDQNSDRLWSSILMSPTNDTCESVEITGVSITFVQRSTTQWKTQLLVKGDSVRKANIKRKIFQWNSLSLLLFVTAPIFCQQYE